MAVDFIPEKTVALIVRLREKCEEVEACDAIRRMCAEMEKEEAVN